MMFAKVTSEAARRESIFQQSVDSEKTRGDALSKRFEEALKQEQEVSRQIDLLYELTFKEKAFATQVELQWFLTEQVEEEKTARDIVAKFHLVKHDPAALLDLDRELGNRSTTE